MILLQNSEYSTRQTKRRDADVSRAPAATMVNLTLLYT